MTLKVKSDLLQKEEASLLSDIQTAKAEMKLFESSAEVLKVATAIRKQEMQTKIEELVTKGVRAVFQRDDYTFRFKLNVTSKYIAMVPIIESTHDNQKIENDILDGHGGGLADIVSFILRVTFLVISRPKLARFMIVDEMFKHVDEGRIRGVTTLLKELSQSLGIQFVLVTHQTELSDGADVIYRATSGKDGTTLTLEHDMQDELYHTKQNDLVTQPEQSTVKVPKKVKKKRKDTSAFSAVIGEKMERSKWRQIEEMDY